MAWRGWYSIVVVQMCIKAVTMPGLAIPYEKSTRVTHIANDYLKALLSLEARKDLAPASRPTRSTAAVTHVEPHAANGCRTPGNSHPIPQASGAKAQIQGLGLDLDGSGSMPRRPKATTSGTASQFLVQARERLADDLPRLQTLAFRI